MARQIEERDNFNTTILNDEFKGKKITPYTWVYRWQNCTEFSFNEAEEEIQPENIALKYNKSDQHKYFRQILEGKAHIVGITNIRQVNIHSYC